MANLLSFFLAQTIPATPGGIEMETTSDADESHNPFPSLTQRARLATGYNEAAVQKRILDRYHAGHSYG